MTWSRKLAVAAALSAAIVGQTPLAAGQDRPAEALRKQVAEREGIPLDRLRAGDLVEQEYPTTGRTVVRAKLVDRQTHKVYGAALDERGRQVEPREAGRDERRAKADKFGKIEPALQERLERAATADAKIPVAIWVEAPEPPVQAARAAASPAEARQRVQRQMDAVRQVVAPRGQAVAAAARAQGANARAAELSPVVFAKLTQGQIQALARRSDVAAIYGQLPIQRFQDDAGTTSRAHRVFARGNKGQDATSFPVIHEDDGISDDNPYLHNGKHEVTYWCTGEDEGPGGSECEFGKNIIDPHASEVAGAIASTQKLFRGLAPNVPGLLSANTQTFDNDRIVEAFEWAREAGGDPTNMSWGTICPSGQQNFYSRFVDYAVRNLRATVVVAAGNRNSGCSDNRRVSSPGQAWNAITVGSFEDGDDGFWSNDDLSNFSQYQDPGFASGMDKPEVVAVGVIRSTDEEDIENDEAEGTSFSTPQVTGQIALMLSRQPGQNVWPETNKAAVLASAFHDVDPGSIEKDGVGGIVASISDTTYRQKRFINDCEGSGCDLLTESDFTRRHHDVVELEEGQVARVAIAWSAVSTDTDVNSQLGADLDLRVRGPDDSTIVCDSTSAQNAWEMCEFTAPEDGTYDILIDLFECPETDCSDWPGTFLGIAWSIREIPGACSNLIEVPEGGDTRTVKLNTGATYFDSYSGWPFDQEGRERLLKITTDSTADISATDTNDEVDLHIVEIDDCDDDPVEPDVLASGEDDVELNNAPAGTYYLIVDGRNRRVSKTEVTVTISP